ncbi:alpha/beta fold hydrolase [Labedella endophytica]|uniref:Alpha/beta hydrolase n=1 Tax=Labedella endophytica TaxID=1523160 RepID=A0A3S0XN02_9MICO|nr:alpha/beta hydrolase [Labedella endophytica]RUR00989.1 alpha/beta hydrolase [Labedella endophytica]
MRLHSTTAGDGARHIGLVHGLGADGTTWDPLVERLLTTGRYRITTIDLRGHGRSDRASSYALDDLANDLAETLPPQLHGVIGHSLGGAVLARAVEHLAPERAIYLDPGFRLTIPTTGIAGRLFWLVPIVTLGAAQLLQARKTAASRARYPADVQTAMKAAQARFDTRMAIEVFRDVAFHPVPVAPPVVPSTIVLSDDSPAVLPDVYASKLEAAGWEVRRIPGVHHDMHLEDPGRTAEMILDLL